VNGVRLEDGQVAEICLEVERWVDAIGQRLDAGNVLTIDYGHETRSLYDGSRRDGTLVCQREYRVHDDPFARIGEQDITAHVDFGNLRRCGRAHGWIDGELCSLRVFLVGFGALETVSSYEGDEGATRRHLALRHLFVSEIADTHRVLLQSRGERARRVQFGRARLEPSPT
jgi:SAM-dependent MidA family methyltransferase